MICNTACMTDVVVAGRMTTAALSFTQVDPAVLSELPQEVRDELTALLPPTNKASHVRTDKHQTANAHFEVLRQNHGFEARHQHQMHHEKDLLSITVCDPLADESAQDLWAALQEALLLLATENDNNTADLDVGSGNHSSHQQSAEGGSTVAKLRAVQGIAVQWVAAHVQHDLEGVHWFLRRLSGFRHQVGMVQQAVASLIQAVQQKVKDVHGATLQTRSFLL